MKLGGMILISLEGMKESCAVIRGFSFFFLLRMRGREKETEEGENKRNARWMERNRQQNLLWEKYGDGEPCQTRRWQPRRPLVLRVFDW